LPKRRERLIRDNCWATQLGHYIVNGAAADNTPNRQFLEPKQLSQKAYNEWIKRLASIK
jgi:hypothetical protein